MRTHLVMRESMKESPHLNIPHLHHDIPIPPPRRRRHDILIKRERDKHNRHQQIHHRAHRAHRLGNLLLVNFTQILPFQAGFHEGWAKPSDHGVGGAESHAAEGQRGDERLAIAVEGVCYDGDAGEEEGDEAQLFCDGQF